LAHALPGVDHASKLGIKFSNFFQQAARQTAQPQFHNSPAIPATQLHYAATKACYREALQACRSSPLPTNYNCD
jgi:hypothetical protein